MSKDSYTVHVHDEASTNLAPHADGANGVHSAGTVGGHEHLYLVGQGSSLPNNNVRAFDPGSADLGSEPRAGPVT